MQPDGKIVIAGYTYSSSATSAAVVRCLPNGTLDSAFGAGGIIITNFGVTLLSAYSVRLQANGRIVVGGQYWDHTVTPWLHDFSLFRLLPNGAVDASFGDGGLVHHNMPPNSTVHDSGLNGLFIQSDGSIVGAGWGVGSAYRAFAVARYLGDAVGLDIGLRAYDGASVVKLACEAPGSTNSPFRISKNGAMYGVLLTETNAVNASKFRLQTRSGTKALLKVP